MKRLGCRRSRWFLGAFGVSVSVLAGLVATPAGAATVTLVHSSAAIGRFAADGHVITWGTKTRPAGNFFRPQWVYIRDLNRGRQSRFVEQTSLGPTNLAVGGQRIVWTDVVDDGPTVLMFTAELGGVAHEYPGAYGSVFAGGGLPIRVITQMAGDGTRLGFAWYQWDYRDPDPCINPPGSPPPGACDEVVQKGGVRLIEGPRRPSIPNVPPAWRLAVAGDRIAFVPLVAGQKRKIHPSTVQIRSAATGTLLATASWSAGRPRAIAITRRRLAVLINQGGAMRIAIFSTATGNQLANYPVSSTTGASLQMSSAGVMFQTNISHPQLRLLDPTTAARRTIANLRRSPVAFSLQGTHARWAINLRSGGYIRESKVS